MIGNFAHTDNDKKMKAPIANNSPWAKLSTLLDLKIITKPKAERAYKKPMESPLTSS